MGEIFDKIWFTGKIINVLSKIDKYSEEAVDLLMGTCAQESGFGKYNRQLGGGPAVGVFQMEPATHDDIWDNYLCYKRVFVEQNEIERKPAESLVYDLEYAIIMCRIHYLRVRESIPKRMDDNYIKRLGEFYKVHYNTYLGKATVEEFIENYHRYVL